MKNNSISFIAPWIGLLLGLIISCGLSFFFNENPFNVFKILTTSFFNSRFDLGLTLFYTTCLIFSGLAFSIPLKTGLFHIGSEGQILFSAFIAAWIGSQWHWPFWPLMIGLVVITLVTGVICSSIITFFKIYRGSHEVVVAIMLNFTLASLSTWLTVHYLQNPESQNPETAVIQPHLQFLKNDFLKTYFDQSPVSVFFLIAIFCCFILYYLEQKTNWGYKVLCYGVNPRAAERLLIKKEQILTFSLGLAGFFSAMVSLTEVIGNSFQFKIGFSPQYGFLGIAVALLARQNFIGIIFSSFLMACLHKGASDLDLETAHLTRDYSKILQALIIFSVAASYFLIQKWQNKKKVKYD